MLNIRCFGLQEYESVFDNMRQYTKQRDLNSADEFWCLQHFPVFTLGANADQKHILKRTDIPVIQTDRGGQVTYHGPGQLIIYLMMDLKRKNIGVKQLVGKIEQSVVSVLKQYNILSEARAEAHGVYVNNAKIASLGLRVSRGSSYHGLALNVDMDLKPFSLINPCGFKDLAVTQVKDHYKSVSINDLTKQLAENLYQQLNYKDHQITFHDE